MLLPSPSLLHYNNTKNKKPSLLHYSNKKKGDDNIVAIAFFVVL
jgi:hypothetical protein